MPETTYKIIKYPNFISCSKCKKIWFEAKNQREIKIKSFNAECEINFNSIRLTCKCGNEILLESDIPDDISNAEQYAMAGESEWAALILESQKVTPYDKWFFDLSSLHRNALLKKLSEKQKRLYKIILDTNGNSEKIKAQYDLAETVIVNDIGKIIKEIEVITGKKYQYPKKP